MSDTIHTTSDREWLTTGDAARAIRTGRRRIYRAVKRHQLKAAVINGRGELRIHRDWLRSWLESLAERS